MVLYLRILSVSEKYDVSGYDLSHTTSILFSLVFIYQFIYLFIYIIWVGTD